jgi:CHASE3 domain sensor protein
MDAALNDVIITRIADVGGKIFMDQIRVNLEDLSKVKRSDLTLRPGDVIQIEKTGWSTFRDTFTVIVGAAIITTAVANIIIASRY